MSLLSIAIFIAIIILTTVKPDREDMPAFVPSIQNYKENLSKSKITKEQMKIAKHKINQEKIKKSYEGNIVERNGYSKTNKIEEHQIESPIQVKDKPTGVAAKPRTFNSHFTSTGFGVTSNSYYGSPVYHHHAIGFDPINIMVSVSIVSFLLQALQGLLARARLPTAVVEARGLNLKSSNLQRKNLKPFKIYNYNKKSGAKEILR